MNLAKVQFALRELPRNFQSPKTWSALGFATFLCALSGPFGTSETLLFSTRLLYWAFISVATYCVGTFGHALAVQYSFTKTSAQHIVLAAVVGFTITCLISLTNYIVIPNYPTSFGMVMRITGTIFLIAAMIFAIVTYFLRTTEQSNKTQSPLLSKLDHNKRGDIVSLHAEDHYVRVETTQGSSLLLIRLADAIALLPPDTGLQIHRSHWIALDHVQNYSKKDGNWSITLSNDHSVPISRSYRSAAIKAGLVPARG